MLLAMSDATLTNPMGNSYIKNLSMLATLKYTQHVVEIWKKIYIIQTSLVVALEKIKLPTHMVEGEHNLRNKPQTHLHQPILIHWYFKIMELIFNTYCYVLYSDLI